MRTTKALFYELMYDFQSERWNEFELPMLSSRELLALAKLLGCPSCGSKETRHKGGRVYTKHKENWYSGPTTDRLAACGTTRADFSWRDRN